MGLWAFFFLIHVERERENIVTEPGNEFPPMPMYRRKKAIFVNRARIYL